LAACGLVGLLIATIGSNNTARQAKKQRFWAKGGPRTVTASYPVTKSHFLLFCF